MPTECAGAVLIVDDHPLFRDALAEALKRSRPDLESRFATTAAEALDAVADTGVTLVLLDLQLAGDSGFDTLMKISGARPDLPVAIVSATEKPEAYRKALSLGAVGYLPKSLSLEQLGHALSRLVSGESWFPEEIESVAEGEDSPEARLASLTPAQRRVLGGLSEGLLNKQIAYEMDISEATVKAHMTAIFRKLGVSNRTQALLMLRDVTEIER
jgi:DNA-binding NarL/FixJ family response regulator